MTTYSIDEVSKQSGISASCIRVWEQRYGWPKPDRTPNGYRSFKMFELEQLKKIKHFMDKGILIGQLIVDGMVTFPVETPTFERKVLTLKHFEDLNYKHKFSAELIDHLLKKEFGKVAHMVQESVVVLRASERMPLCYAIIRRAIDGYTKIGVKVDELEQCLQCIAC